MNLHVAVRALRDRRRGLLGWAAGISLYVTMIVVVWPSIRASAQITQAIKDYPQALKEFFGGSASFDFSTAAGYLNAELFSLLVPLLLAVFAIGFGASTVAGERERGLLDLILVNPVSRRRVATEKALALAAAVALLAVVAALVMRAVGATVDLGVEAIGVAAAFTGAVLLCVLHGYVALLVGAATGSRAAAIGAAAALFTAGYLLQALAGLVSWLEPLRVLSPFYLYNGSTPLAHGFPVVHHLVLAGLCLAVFLATAVAFERRDVVG